MYLSEPFMQLQKYFFVSNWQDWPEEEKAGREEELSRTVWIWLGSLQLQPWNSTALFQPTLTHFGRM